MPAPRAPQSTKYFGHVSVVRVPPVLGAADLGSLLRRFCIPILRHHTWEHGTWRGTGAELWAVSACLPPE